MSGLPVRIRPAVPTDAAAISALLPQLGYELAPERLADKLSRFAASTNDGVLIAERNGELLGLISMHALEFFHADGNLGRITALVVAESGRGQGIGTALIHAAESWFLARGVTHAEVTSSEHRTAARQFYESCGYAVIKQRFVKNLKPE
ncbi:GNAT superfamily N-acetyltransferase [Silvimonas terrae]|uniref:GNAT superfamily N-acetyltransferase n=1 Tax=Silvimonas terrae TaxID=300266 RepID=A0A840RGD3_9NEIS|nr:GNAT family N-acetyltransferase [Silvimonas terrae]MBB5191396.1 GNAT superfamily N-acetyltransferase [Silvimonas terrae]